MASINQALNCGGFGVHQVCHVTNFYNAMNFTNVCTGAVSKYNDLVHQIDSPVNKYNAPYAIYHFCCYCKF